MSGWDPGTAIPIVSAGFFFAIGAINLFVPPRPSAPSAWLIEARLRYGGDFNVTAPQPVSVGWMRVSGGAAILLGALQLLPRREPVFNRALLLSMGGFLLAIGLGMLIARLLSPPAKGETWSGRRQRRKFEQRVARGTDAYFEELRTILSQDPPPSRAPRWEIVSLVLAILFGGAFLALGLMEAR